MKTLLLLLVALVAVSFSFTIPEKSTKQQLQRSYVAELLKYEQTPYAPYGETSGISCSTLIREALVKTPGIDEITRASVQSASCSSNELKKGCDEQLSTIAEAKNLAELDYNQLQQGDVVVIGNSVGIHTMAYIGDETWIHSDPITQKVSRISKIDDSTGDKDIDWFDFKVTVLRWNIFKN